MLLIGIFAKSWDHIGVFTNFVFMPLTMLGGVFWSIDMLKSEILKGISYVNPIYWMINGLRDAMLGSSDVSAHLCITISASFAILFTIIASYTFSKGYKIKS